MARKGNAGWIPLVHLPDYLKDLNAMHEVEVWVRDESGLHFSVWNKYVTGLSPVATAAQRAEKLLRTIGKWKD